MVEIQPIRVEIEREQRRVERRREMQRRKRVAAVAVVVRRLGADGRAHRRGPPRLGEGPAETVLHAGRDRRGLRIRLQRPRARPARGAGALDRRAAAGCAGNRL